MTVLGKSRALNVEGYEASVDTHNASNCRYNTGKIQNNSVYCHLLDQWLSVNYCAQMCQKYEAKP